MVEIKMVKTKKQQKEFIKFADILYKEDNEYVPYYHRREKKLFSHSHNPNLNANECVAMLAYQDGRLAGRIMCSKNRIEATKDKTVRFSHFDCINDSAVSDALLDKVCDWANTLNAEKVVGELGFNDMMECGIVLTNDLPVMATIQLKYNFEYYSNLLKSFGFSNSKKLYEYQLFLKNDFDIDNAGINLNKMLSKNDFKFIVGDKKFKISMYGRKVFDLLYENDISGHPSVIEDKVYLNYLKELNKLFDSNNFIILANKSDDVVGAMLITRNTSLALQTTRGNVINSKRMYTVGGEYRNEYDISMLAVDKKYCSDVMEIFSDFLASKFSVDNYYSVFTNAWINNETKKQILSRNFDVKLIRTRGIFTKNLREKVNFKPVVKRSTADLIGRKLIGNKSTLK